MTPTLALAPLLATTLVACGGSSSDDQAGLIATTGVWADVASAVTGDEVPAILTGTSIDPHHYEPTAQDLARVKAANTVIVNGGGYDAALYEVAEQDRVINAFDLAGLEDSHEDTHEHDHDAQDHEGHDYGEHHHDHSVNEHVWFSPDAITAVAKEVEARAGGDATEVVSRMAALKQKIADLPHLHVAQTESIADHLIAGSGMHDITPAEYRKAALNHQETSASAVASFIQEIEEGHVDVLIVNPQSMTSAAQRIVDAAKANNTTIVEITELPPAGTSVLDYVEQVADALVESAQ